MNQHLFIARFINKSQGKTAETTAQYIQCQQNSRNVSLSKGNIKT